MKRNPLNDALRLLKYRVRSEKEIRVRLKSKGYSDEEVEKTVLKLKEKGFLDDEKFAYLYTYDSLTLKKKGPFLIRMELKNLGVDEFIIEDALKKVLEEVNVEEIKEEITKGLDEKKAKEYLYRRGFGGE
ncbi:RecX family transcriptional regulator [Thermosipho melanesiensis]|uniref:Regulatory protein RecX n=2 Tax=Thermosipho melanesiensis TaxID=46541 RepID=A6LM63_THEM4|nr:regulatory protein RecX [Thermosipho melanesiensis BI429]APT74108.1 RecX family transcriptional regulator [Thermosipho melanesiensis]OOC36055.1 RecX family transcriptional regulator [Thermosipho melanesiensis]OOC36872.1 RecX family transcriptional regulator [Thermosipho melanesiensis]OOC37623.1 RecX family transcriptional regulator [Thermosipho melanesiensis]